MTQEEQIKQVAEYDGWKQHPQTEWMRYKEGEECVSDLMLAERYVSLDWLNPVWVKVNSEMKKRVLSRKNKVDHAAINQRFQITASYHGSIDTGNISAALTAVSDAITWLKEQKK